MFARMSRSVCAFVIFSGLQNAAVLRSWPWKMLVHFFVQIFDAFYASADWRGGPREEIIRSIETSTKTVVNLAPESVDGLRVQSS